MYKVIESDYWYMRIRLVAFRAREACEILDAGCLRVLFGADACPQPTSRDGPVGGSSGETMPWEQQVGTRTRPSRARGGRLVRPPRGLWRHDGTGCAEMRLVPS